MSIIFQKGKITIAVNQFVIIAVITAFFTKIPLL